MKRRNNKTAQNKKKKNPKNRNSNVNESNPFLEKKEACHYCHRFYTHAYMSRHVLYHCRDSPHYLPPAPAPPLHNKVDKPPPLHEVTIPPDQPSCAQRTSSSKDEILCSANSNVLEEPEAASGNDDNQSFHSTQSELSMADPADRKQPSGKQIAEDQSSWTECYCSETWSHHSEDHHTTFQVGNFSPGHDSSSSSLAQSTESSGGQSLSFREQLEKERRTLQEELSKLGHLKGGHPSSKDTLAGFFTDHSNQQHKTARQLEDSNFLQEEEEDIASLNSNDSHTTQGVVAPLVGNENNLYQPQNLPPYIPDEVHPFLEFPVMKSVEHIPNIGDPCNYPANHPSYQTQKLDNMTCSMLRLIDYCDKRPNTSRKFLDGLIDVIKEEVKTRRFDILKAPRRKTIIRRVKKKYGRDTKGRDTGPVIRWMRLTSRQDPYRVTVPNEIDTRERDMICVIRFNLVKNIKDQLSMRPVFGNLDNLVINRNNRWDLYWSHPADNDEIMDGSWYQTSNHRLLAAGFNQRTDFRLAFMVYCDKTGCDVNQRYPLEPFIMCPVMIRRKLRYVPMTWRAVAFVPDLESKSAAEKEYIRRQVKGATARNYHRCLRWILEAFAELEREGFLYWMRLGDEVNYVRVRPELALVLGDGKSADMLTLRVCGHYKSKRISRSCKVSQQHCDSVTHVCQYMKASDLYPAQYILDKGGHLALIGHQHTKFTLRCLDAHFDSDDEQSLPDISADDAKRIFEACEKILNDDNHVYAFPNAFTQACILFGLDVRGIMGATPVDMMHVYQSGIVRYLVLMVLQSMPIEAKSELDRMVDRILASLRSSELPFFPRCTFAKGFSIITQITSDEWVGKLFALVIISRTRRGEELLLSSKAITKDDLSRPAGVGDDDRPIGFTNVSEHLTRHRLAELYDEAAQDLLGAGNADCPSEDSNPPELENNNTDDDDEIVLRPCSLNDFREIAEALLCFHSWYKDEFPSMDWTDRNAAKASIGSAVSKMLAMLKYYVPRKKGNRWKIQKFHDLLHLPEDMDRWGSAKNFDVSALESALRYWAKLPAMTSQMQGYSDFVRQVAYRIEESCILARARRENFVYGEWESAIPNLTPAPGIPKEARSTLKGSWFMVYRPERDDAPPRQTSWSGDDKRRLGNLSLHPLIEEYIRAGQLDDDDILLDQLDKVLPMLQTMDDGRQVGFWKGYTECDVVIGPNLICSDRRRLTFRCHPNYQNKGKWYDWAMISFKDDGDKREHYIFPEEPGKPEIETSYPRGTVPAKVLAFVVVPDDQNRGDCPNDNPPDNIRAIVHCAEYQDRTDAEEGSVLTETWKMEYHPLNERDKLDKDRKPRLRLVGLHSFVDRVLAIEENPAAKTCLYESVPLFEEKGDGYIRTNADKVLLIRHYDNWRTDFL
jgi:hypothetical protein